MSVQLAEEKLFLCAVNTLQRAFNILTMWKIPSVSPPIGANFQSGSVNVLIHVKEISLVTSSGSCWFITIATQIKSNIN